MTPNPKDLSEREACEVAMGLAQRLMRGEIIWQTRYAAECAVAVEALVNALMASRNCGETDAATPPPACADPNGWFGMDAEPAIGRKFIALYDDGSGAAMYWRHDDGLIDHNGDDCAWDWPLPSHDRWSYLPENLEFWCECQAEDPTVLPLPQGPSVDRDGLARDRSEPAEQKGGAQ